MAPFGGQARARARAALRCRLRARGPSASPASGLDAAKPPPSPIAFTGSVALAKRRLEVYDLHAMRAHKPEDFYDDSFSLNAREGTAKTPRTKS